MSRSTYREFLRSPLAWDLLLALFTFAWSFVFIRLFAPGRINVDIANQYKQATGTIPFTDWHPPVMSVVWRLLIDLTGRPGSLLVLQVVLLAAAALIIGVIINRSGASRWVSLLGPVIMATPWALSQLTTLWKDTQMAVALMLAVALLAITRFVPKTWVLWLPTIVLLVYAVALRKNAVFTLVPIAVYGAYCLRGPLGKAIRGRMRDGGNDHRLGRVRGSLHTFMDRAPRWSIVGLSLLVIGVVGFGSIATEKLIESRVEVAHNGQISQIFLDDVMFSVPYSQLQASDAPAELKDHISEARDVCLEKGEIWDAYWNCYGRGVTGRAFSPVEYQDELKDLWLSEVITHPVRYVEYRSAVFSYYFFSSKLEYWEADWSGDADKVGYETGSVKADYIFRPYVEDFALATFPMLFKPWFWSLIAAVLLGLAVRARRQNRAGAGIAPRSVSGSAVDTSARSKLRHTPTFWPEISVMAASALCYISGYFPTVPANHFRYTYWPTLAVTFAVVLWLAQRSVQRVRNIEP